MSGPGLLRRNIAAAPTMLRVGWAEMVAYRAEMVIWILTASLPLVMLALWDAVAAEGPLAGWGQAEFARYFTITLIVRQLTSTWIVWELNHTIRSGSLSTALLKPAGALSYNLAVTVAALPFRLIVLAPIVAALLWWRPELLWTPTPGAVALFLASTALAFAINWLTQCLIGIFSFWFDQTLGIFNLYFAFWAVLSGYFVPSALLGPVADVARWLPFYAGVGAPIDLLMDPGHAPWAVLATQAGWVVVIGAAVAWAWRRGLRRYGAFGA